MSLFAQRLISKNACYWQCRRVFHQRSYGAATLLHATTHNEDVDSSLPSISSSSTPTQMKGAVKKRRTESRDNKKEQPTTPLENGKIQAYLDQVENASITVQDLERFKPARYGTPGTPQYEKDYNSLLDNILRSFSAEQLRHFAKSYNLPSKKRGAKRECAVAIIEDSWKMPSLGDIKKQLRDSSEVAQQEFLLDPSQCFLLLGKDGSDLLQLSSKYNVHVSLSAAPLCLKAEGVRSALEKLAGYITHFKEDIDIKLFDIDNVKNISIELLHHVSRKSGAFIQYNNERKLCITYRKSDPSALSAAKRLLTMAVAEQTVSSHLYYKLAEAGEPEAPLGALKRSYALYPFILPYTHPRHSTTISKFRIRNVKASGAPDTEAGGLLGETNNVTDAITQRICDVKDALLDALQADNTLSGSTRIIRAIPGHFLWVYPGDNASMTPVLAGASPFEKVAKWISDHRASGFFFSSSPTQVLSIPPKRQKILRRLTYKSSLSEPTSGSQIMVFEIILASKSYPSTEVPAIKDILTSEHDLLKPFCHIDSESVMDVMLPDRAMDIRFSVTDSVSLSRPKWPAKLEEYYNQLETFLSGSGEVHQPEIPLKFRHNDIDFILQSTDNVRQSMKSVQGDANVTRFDAVTENITSTEDDESSILCQVGPIAIPFGYSNQILN
ncbi:hypothetical protein BDQ17DRAFT_1418336 [Cyathus striatus]|nr:hypothetical protein BDQ17DRAFT_1418336 [Cyathus striatus]